MSAAVAKPSIIAVEEHYYDEALAGIVPVPPPLRARLADLAEQRIAEMDEAGIALQVLSHAPPALQALPPADSVTWSRRANDNLAATVRRRPDRFAAFAALPTPDPQAAADELARCVGELGFKGTMLHGMTAGVFHDDERFWPIFERAAALRVPVYLHPGLPHPAVVDAYYRDRLAKHPTLLHAGLGFTVEMLTAGVRMAISGVFDRYPDLQVILGHLGEGLPFLVERIDESLSRDTGGARSFREAVRNHFHITTSGNFSDPALQCTIAEFGIDRILFAIDWPFVENRPGTDWIRGTNLTDADREKILSGNARRLLELP